MSTTNHYDTGLTGTKSTLRLHLALAVGPPEDEYRLAHRGPTPASLVYDLLALYDIERGNNTRPGTPLPQAAGQP